MRCHRSLLGQRRREQPIYNIRPSRVSGEGCRKSIINTLEKDEFFLRAKRIEIPASITGVPFYLKLGYDYKNGITEPDEEHLIRLEKKRNVV